jgi:hypothetical protein
MESFTRELRRHITQNDAIQGSEWKKITYHIIKQYQKNDSQPFNTGFNIIIVRGPSASYTKYGRLCILLDWTNGTRHDLITCNLWPKPEITTDQELNTMPMHDKPWGTELNSWKSHGTATTSKTWAESSAKLTNPRSISTAATMDRSTISYDPYLSTQIFTKVNIDAPKSADKIWIGVYPPSGARNATAGQATMTKYMTNAFDGKRCANSKVEQRKQNQQYHFDPPQQQDRQYVQNDNNKRSNTAYGRDSYQDNRSQNDRGRSPSRDRSNSHTRSPRSSGDNQQNGA